MTRLFWWFTVPIFIIIISLKVTKCARNFLTLGTQFPRNHSESWCVYGRTVERELVLKKLCSLALTRPCCKKLKEKEKKSYKKFVSRWALCFYGSDWKRRKKSFFRRIFFVVVLQFIRAGREDIWLSVMAYGPRCARYDREPNIFLSSPPIQSIRASYRNALIRTGKDLTVLVTIKCVIKDEKLSYLKKFCKWHSVGKSAQVIKTENLKRIRQIIF